MLAPSDATVPNRNIILFSDERFYGKDTQPLPDWYQIRMLSASLSALRHVLGGARLDRSLQRVPSIFPVVPNAYKEHFDVCKHGLYVGRHQVIDVKPRLISV